MAALEQTTTKRPKVQSKVQQAILEAERNAQLKYRGRPSVDDYDERAVCSGHAHEIVPGLYLGSMHSCAADKGDALAALGVTGIINCTTDQEAACHHQRTSGDAAAPAAAPATDAAAGARPFECEYVRVSIYDNEAAEIMPYLEGSTAFIRRHIEAGGSVLVHCQRGVSRSASVVIAYLIAHGTAEGMTRDEAYVQVKRRRRVVDPNVGFWEQLLAFEQRGNGSSGAGGGEAEAGLPVAFDMAWCRKSVATFSMGAHEEAFADVADCNAKDALAGGLEFVLSRGIRDSDMAWLGAMCRWVTGLGGVGGSALVMEIMGWNGEAVTGEMQENWGVDFPAREFARLVAGLPGRFII
mmetsp:Transcript_34842/g.93067  ORF Transcript_34842/g.93067 Transcript_34842/m.93067 type:complete len:353 (+) Transcript_34842:78-1136(+)